MSSFKDERNELMYELVEANRISMGLNKTEFADKCGISKQYLTKMLREKNFTRKAVEGVSRAIGYNINSLTNEELKDKLDECNLMNMTVHIQRLSNAKVKEMKLGEFTISLPRKYFKYSNKWYGFVADTLDLLEYGVDVNDILLVRDNAFTNLMLVSEDGEKLEFIQKNCFNPNKYQFFGSVAHIIKEVK